MFHKSKLRTILIVASMLSAALFLYFAYAGTKNYLGYCNKTGRKLSDDEAIQIAVSKILKIYPPALNEYSKLDTGQKIIKFFKPKNYIPYKSVKQFLMDNENCCKVTARNKGDFGKEGDAISIAGRIFGIKGRNVRAHYKVRYMNDNGFIETKEIEQFIHVMNCENPQN